MRVNADVRLVGAKVVLVPYKRHHVDKYGGTGGTGYSAPMQMQLTRF